MEKPNYYSNLDLTMIGVDQSLSDVAAHIEALQLYIEYLEGQKL